MAAGLLERMLDARDREYVLGDLAEEYERVAGVRGERAARAWYRREVVRALVPALRRRIGRRERVMAGVEGRGQGKVEWLKTMAGDARLAWRGLMRRPAWVFGVLLTLGVAIGSNAATFGVVDAVLLRGMPYPEDGRIVSFSEVHAERLQDLGWASIPNYADWREQSRSFVAMSLFRGRSMAVTGDGDPLYVYGAYVTPSFFDVFGVPASRGRAFSEDDVEAAVGGAVVVSHGLWQRRFGSDPSLVGETIVIDGTARVVMGIMPASFNAPGEWIDPQVRMDVWVPLAIDPAQESRGSRSFNVIGRLSSRVTLEEARREMERISTDLARAYPEANEGWRVRLLPWKDVVVGTTRRLLFPLWGAMGVMLLVACANVGNLVLNRSLARRTEYATRAALGAGGGRLLGQAVLEALVLGTIGAALGLLIAWGLLGAARFLDPGDVPRLSEAVVNIRVALVTAVLALIVSAGLAVIPAWRSARADIHEALRRSVRVGGASGLTRRARDAMVVLQLALALALLAGSALVLQGFLRMRDVSPGFEPEGVLAATVALSWDRVPEPEQRAAFTRDVLARLRSLPGVESAAMINSLPFSGSNQQQTFGIDGVPVDESPPFASLRGISPDYLATMRIPLVRGRDFTEPDLGGPLRTVLVNEALAKRYLADREPLGVRLVLFGGDVIAEVVGVTGDVRHFGLDQDVVPEIYVPYTTDGLTSKSYVVRTAGDPLALAASVRAAIHDVDPAQPLRATGRERAETMTMRALVDASLAAPRFYTLVLVLLTGVALVLAAVGLFAAVAISVTERRREIGLRMALGAERSRVMVWMLARIGRVAGLAIVLGVLVTVAAGRTLEALLFGASARDPMILTMVVLGFCLIALAAVLLPAGRVMRIDPAIELRQQ